MSPRVQNMNKVVLLPTLRFYDICTEQMLQNFASVKLRYYITAKMFNIQRFVLNFTNL